MPCSKSAQEIIKRGNFRLIGPTASPLCYHEEVSLGFIQYIQMLGDS